MTTQASVQAITHTLAPTSKINISRGIATHDPPSCSRGAVSCQSNQDMMASMTVSIDLQISEIIIKICLKN